MRLVRWLSVLTLPALALRIAHLLEIRKVFFFDHPVLDALEYVRWGREIASGQILWPELRIHGPLYPFFLGAVFVVSPDNYLLVGILQSLVGVASAWVAAMIARELIDGLLAPLVAFCCVAFGWIFVYYDEQWMPTTFVVFFDLLGTWMTLRAWGEGGRDRHAVGAGLAFGASALAWGPGLAFLPVAALCIAFTRPPSLAAYKRATVCLLAGCASLAPTLAWNRHLSGKWTLTQANAGLNLYIGNNPRADGLPSVQPGVEWEALTQRGISTPEIYVADVVEFWQSAPADAARLLGRKACLLLANPEVCPSQDIGYFRAASRALSLPWPSSGVLIPLGLVGLLAGLARPKGRRLAAIAAPALLLPVAFSVCSRYRLPIEALSAPAAGFLAAWTVHGRARFVRRALALGLVTALGVVSFGDPCGAGRARLFRTHDYAARELFYLGRYEEALREIQLERDVNPTDCEVLYDAAVVSLALGDTEGARRIASRFVRWKPWGWENADWRVGRAAAHVFFRAGRPDHAHLAVEWAAGSWWPRHPVLLALQGKALLQMGSIERAIDSLREATLFKPAIPDAWVDLGAALGQKGEYAESARVSEEATRLAPDNAQAWYNLAVACHFLGRQTDAVRAATRARELGHADGARLLSIVSK